MFLYKLNLEEKRAFLKLAREFIEVNGAISTEEEIFLKRYFEEMGFDKDDPITPPREGEREVLLKSFSTMRSRVSVLLEIIGLGYANRAYCPQEQVFIQELADAFQISAQRLARLEHWVERLFGMLDEAESFWQGRPPLRPKA